MKIIAAAIPLPVDAEFAVTINTGYSFSFFCVIIIRFALAVPLQVPAGNNYSSGVGIKLNG
ncbi:hypothetical protein ACL2XP_24970 [Sodalis sp. RH21]|uniref:hypothetical protein n=1 Tax=unclassified Sodalis (in: enterobacteria) TaxID=2636512 RepID=UPI0039B40FA1